MMRRSFVLLSALTCVAMAPASPLRAQESRPSGEFVDESERYSRDQLENLVSAIALYPDALLAQVLIAATFPDQVDEAARFVRLNGTTNIDDQPWDVSVKSVAHYPSALNMMAEKGDWTAALGRAYALQSGEVMVAVQRLRAMADAQGNLRTTQQQVVTREQADYVIAPAQPRVIYVPVYDPYVVYTRPIFTTASYYTPFWSFGVGFPIGAWLTYDVNWRSRSVYYNGWDTGYYGYASGWRARARPFVQFTTVYVNPRYRTVYVNRDVVRRRVMYGNVDRYVGVHRETRFSRDDGRGRDRADRPRDDFRSDSRYGSGSARSGRDGGGYGGRDGVGFGGTVGGTDRTDRYRSGGERTDRRDGSRQDQRQRGAYDVPAGGMPRNGNGQDDAGEVRGGWNVDRTRGAEMSRERAPSRGDGPAGATEGRRSDERWGGSRGDGPRTRERDAAAPQERAPFSRRDMPMINPRRAEPPPQQQPAAPGQRPQQGGDRSARERPRY